ncbi:hypothetical protein G7Y89_g2073 [Cudoniella acicularis]|uniref:Uncharacterized protein n=1 Tax=Cudoniella acicularis TaxID=354080 RepID=A0A8H4W6F3_9HELO|nr:hypothetical protein G7Y89_g2073 [Cudoniella acicularis]
MPITITAFALAFATLSSAQSTVSLFVPGADLQPLAASIIGSDTLATTYAVQCALESPCGFDGVFTLTEGPSTAAYTLSEGTTSAGTSGMDFTGYWQCSLAGTTSAICTESFGGNGANFPGMSTESYSITYLPVVITAGALASNSGVVTSTSSGSGSTASKTSSTATGTNSSPTITTTSSGSGSTQAPSQTQSTTATPSKAGAHMVVVKVEWVVGMGGAAVALALL